MNFEATSKSAREYADAGKAEEWIHLFLCGKGNNKPFSDGLKLEPRRYYPPRMMSLDLFGRCCGPEFEMKFRVDEDAFLRHVAEIADRYRQGDWDMPPLILCNNRGVYELNDGNHRYEALKGLGAEEYWAIVWETV